MEIFLSRTNWSTESTVSLDFISCISSLFPTCTQITPLSASFNELHLESSVSRLFFHNARFYEEALVRATQTHQWLPNKAGHSSFTQKDMFFCSKQGGEGLAPCLGYYEEELVGGSDGEMEEQVGCSDREK